jgi:mannosyltransferase
LPYVDLKDVRVIAPNFKKRLSGVTSTIIQLVPVQSRLGHQVAVIGPGLPDDLPRIRTSDLWKLWQLGPDNKPRVWHARRNLEMLPGIFMRDILRMKLKLVFTSASQRKHSGWTKFLISKMDSVVATSAKGAAYLTVPNHVVMHGINPERFAPAPDKATQKLNLSLSAQQKYIGCFGRVRKQKGTDLFVDTMISVLPKHPEWSAIVAGRATEQHIGFENELKAKVKAAGLSDRILFVGEHTNINDWYAALDLFIAPQRWEGFGLTPLEAMASGVPVIATDVGAFSELVATDGAQTGVMIPRDDLNAMIDATEALLSDDARLATYADNCRTHVLTHHTIDNEANHLHIAYQDAQTAKS